LICTNKLLEITKYSNGQTWFQRSLMPIWQLPCCSRYMW